LPRPFGDAVRVFEPIDHVQEEQAAEEHQLGGEEQPHAAESRFRLMLPPFVLELDMPHDPGVVCIRPGAVVAAAARLTSPKMQDRASPLCGKRRAASDFAPDDLQRRCIPFVHGTA
jgi:hypothetical protein